MAGRSYGQFCGIARALDLVGDRWALLLVRDLLVGPKRFTELRRGLPKIPTNVLSTRLRELEEAGVVARRLLPRPDSGFVYELTEYGGALEDVLLRLGTWGAARLGEPRPGELLTPDAMVIALRAMFRPEAAGGVEVTFQLELGEVVLHARVADGALAAAVGAAPGPDLVITAGPGIRALFAGEVSTSDALASGLVTVRGDARLFETFGELFRLDAPSGVSSPAVVGR